MKHVVLLSFVALAGCGSINLGPKPAPVVIDNPPDLVRPVARPTGAGFATAPAGARTEEQFDTSSAADRAEATAAASGGRSLGRTIISLGNPAEQGFWLKTPLVRTETPGRAVSIDNGKSVQVTLMPVPDDSGASRMSLAAMRLLEVPLTGLPEIEVFKE